MLEIIIGYAVCIESSKDYINPFQLFFSMKPSTVNPD